MELIEIFILNLVLLFFPILIYILYSTFIKQLMKEQNIIILDLALLSSVIVVLKLNYAVDVYTFSFILNIPLILAYINKRYLVSVLITALLIFNHQITDLSLVLLVIEYLMFFIFRKMKEENFIKMFITVKLAFQTCFIIITKSSIYNLLVSVGGTLLLYILVKYSVYLFNKGKNINKMSLSLEEFEKDKQIRDSLFKITHEIKNPIAVCKSYLDMYDSSNKEHQKYIPIIKEEIDKILYLLQDFLAMNKIKIEPDIMDINMLLEVLVDQYEPVLKANNIKFMYEIWQDELYINGDYNRLNQVFTNIIKNSLEAMDKDNKYIKIYSETDGKNIKIYFEDNGMGIAEEEIEKIKEPFYTTKKNGTGLGVTLSIEIIKAHKGTIFYNSKFGEGTQVIVTLPLLKDFN